MFILVKNTNIITPIENDLYLYYLDYQIKIFLFFEYNDINNIVVVMVNFKD